MLQGQAVVGFVDGVGHRTGNLAENGKHDSFDAVSVLERFLAFGADPFHRRLLFSIVARPSAKRFALGESCRWCQNSNTYSSGWQTACCNCSILACRECGIPLSCSLLRAARVQREAAV